MDINFIIIFFHVLAIIIATIVCLKLGKEALCALTAFLAVLANLFVHKQILLFGINITCSDALAVGYLLGTNLLQEFFGTKIAKKSIFIALFISCAFMLFSYLHLLYRPSPSDTMHEAFFLILSPIARITIASILSFFVVQFIDLKFFSFLKMKTNGKYLGIRLVLSSFLSHSLDSSLFSLLGLYGTVPSIIPIIIFSVVIKMCVGLLATPLFLLARKVVGDVSKV